MKASRNNTAEVYVLKADIKHYFEEVNHNILIGVIKRRIKDSRVVWLIIRILSNRATSLPLHSLRVQDKGMPLGNLTSQFFANVYLNELDQFVKHILKVKYYIRYVDDFVILHKSKYRLEVYGEAVNEFLRAKLLIELHPDKCRIRSLRRGLTFLGFRIYAHHRLLKKVNIRTMHKKFEKFRVLYDSNAESYDAIYEYFQGWLAYANRANTYKLRETLGKRIELAFPNEISTIEFNRLIRYYL